MLLICLFFILFYFFSAEYFSFVISLANFEILSLFSIVFRFRWRQQYRRAYPDEFLRKSDTR